mmetsp:Transcript_6749/g.19742  ORF Transcript_6749/g.19742 Transcript_6749/m.19742 type:complete len:241 (-) Transcript_6749:95-817(-)
MLPEIGDHAFLLSDHGPKCQDHLTRKAVYQEGQQKLLAREGEPADDPQRGRCIEQERLAESGVVLPVNNPSNDVKQGRVHEHEDRVHEHKHPLLVLGEEERHEEQPHHGVHIDVEYGAFVVSAVPSNLHARGSRLEDHVAPQNLSKVSDELVPSPEDVVAVLLELVRAVQRREEHGEPVAKARPGIRQQERNADPPQNKVNVHPVGAHPRSEIGESLGEETACSREENHRPTTTDKHPSR